MENRSAKGLLVVVGTFALAWGAQVGAQGLNKHRPGPSPAAPTPRDQTQAAALVHGDEFSVASDFDYYFPITPGTHFHSENDNGPGTVGTDYMEVGHLCDNVEWCEEVRGLVEFDMQGAGVVDTATFQVEVLMEGGLYDQPGPGEFPIRIVAYEANGIEEIADYDIKPLTTIAAFDSYEYAQNDFISVDVTELWNEAVELGFDHIGFRMEATDYPGTYAMVYGNATMELISGGQVDPLALDFSVQPREVVQGESVTASWQSQGADSCEASGGLPGWAGDKDLDGSQQFIADQTGRFTFRITCRQFIVSLARTAFLDVVAAPPEPGPSVELTALDTSVPLGGLIELEWEAEDALSCTATSGMDGFNGARETSGSESLDASVAGVAKFTLRCVDGEGLADSDSVSVAIDGGKPDLFVQDFAPNKDSLDVDDFLGLNLLAGNAGNGASGATTVRYFLSENAAISPSDTLVGTVNLGAVSVGGSRAASGLNIAAPVVPGRYWLGACINAVAGETNTANNCSKGVSVAVGNNASCAEVATACGAVVGGGLSLQDCQGGPRGAGFPASKQTIDLGAGAELAFEAEWFGGLDGFISLQAPNGGPFVASNDDFEGTGRSRLEFVADTPGEYTLWVTSFEPGADGAFEVTTTCGDGAPDLAPRFVDAPASVLVGEQVALEFEYENQGDSGSASGFLTLVVSPDSVIGTDDSAVSETGIPALAAGEGGGHTFSGSFNQPGNFWMGACITDPAGDELFSANNCSEGRLLAVRNEAECATQSLGLNASADGEVLENDCDDSPRGAGFPSRGHTFTGGKGDVIVAEVSWDDWDGYVYLEGPDGRVVAQADDAGNDFFNAVVTSAERDRDGLKGLLPPDDARVRTGEESSAIAVELPQNGQYTLWLTGFEPRTKGSYGVSVSQADVPAPAFEVTSLGLNKTTVDAGSQAVATLDLEDLQGGGYAVEVFFLLSSNSTLSDEDPIVAQRVSDTLGASGTTSVQAFVPAPQSPGTYWVGACARAQGNDGGVTDEASCRLQELQVTSDAERIAFNPGLNDTWFNPDTNGQGFFIEVFQDIGSVFLTWFTYETDGTPLSVTADVGDEGHRWFTAQGEYDETGVDLAVTVTSGGQFDNPKAVSRSTDGSMRLEFLGCDAGVLSYDIPSQSSGRLQGTIPIQRVVKDNLFLCENYLQANEGATTQASVGVSGTEVKAGDDVTVVWEAPDGMSCRPDGATGAWKDAALVGTRGTERVTLAQAGEHQVALKCKDGKGRSTSAMASVKARDPQDRIQATGPEIVVNEGLNDAWVDPSTDGQGLLINVFPELDTVFAAWFTFDTFDPGAANFDIAAPGHRWVTAYGPIVGNEAELTMTLSRGGAFDVGNPAPSNVTPYGTLDLRFDSCDAITAQYAIPSAGEQGTLDLQRVTQDRVASCVTKSGTGEDEGRLVAPTDKDRLENACNGSLDWEFQWEATPLFETYQIQVRQESDEQPRVDEKVGTNRYTLSKSNPIPEGQLDGWTWRVRGVIEYPQFVVLGDWSEYEFSVSPLAQCP